MLKDPHQGFNNTLDRVGRRGTCTSMFVTGKLNIREENLNTCAVYFIWAVTLQASDSPVTPICQRKPPRLALFCKAVPAQLPLRSITWFTAPPLYSSINQVEAIVGILFYLLFSPFQLFLPKQSPHIFSLWKRKSLQCKSDASVHSCRGRHVENGLISSDGGAAKICVAGLTSDPH